MDPQTPTRSRDRLSDAKRLLLEKRIRGQVRHAAPASAIRRAAGGPVYPMSFAQERLWVLDQTDPGNAFYNIPAAYLISARVDIPTLERAFTEIIRRHESLRTVFRMVDGEPRQIVQPPYPFRVEVQDIRGPGGQPAPEDVIRQRIADTGALPFDLAQGPLVRVHLFRVSESDCALLVNVHHIVTDGWSMPIVMREMDELYEAYARGLPYPLQPLEVGYPDYSVWQRGYLTGDTLRRHLDYWRGHMSGAPTLELPSDRPRPPVLSYRGGMHRFVWPAALTERIRAAMVQTGATMNMVIMAGFYLMLHRYSGQDDLVVGTLLGNRNRAELEPLVGFFVNSAPVRVRVRGEMTFRELVAQVRTAVLDADAHQDLPFDRIVEEVTTERDPSRSPLFQVMYFHHTFVNDVHHKADSEFRSELNLRSLFQETGVTLVDTRTTKFDLTFATMEEEDGVLANMCEYSTDLWDEETMARMMEHCRVLLAHAVADIDSAVSAHPMLTDPERERLLAWGTNERGMEVAGTLIGRFAAHSARSPDATAVEYADASLAYSELDARSNRVARRLLAMGIRPGDHVGVAASASAEMVVALAGVLKAGAAVVPLDPEYPADRLAFMAADAGVRVVVGRGEIAIGGVRTLDLAADAASIAAEDASALPLLARPHDTAYVTFTSGSTGRPKAVLTSHRALVRSFVDDEYVQVRPGDRVMQAAALSFDAAQFEVWAPLMNGATSVGIDRDLLLSPVDFARALRERRITVAFLTTQLFNRHLREVPGVFAALRCLMFGGERVDPAAVRICLERGRPERLLHVYGPTETAVFATAHAVDAVAADAHTVPVGRPISATRVYVLDGRGMHSGIGVPGELCIGGGRVSSGYLHRPELTAERFVPDPFGADADARMYRTGDRVRWRADGTLEFLGRVDWQVKVRGHRIEPGEVEAALREHPAVRDCVVVAREDGGERRLVAYAAGPGAELADTELRPFLKRRLPDYMIPSAFVALDDLPLTPNGKVDRQRLPVPDAVGTQADGYVAPRTPVERILADLWATVLRVERAGIHDNFFALGGDSILSIQIVARAAERGVRVRPKQMFTHQTIAELASVATAAISAEAEQGAVTGEVPLTPVQRWFLSQDHPEPHHFNLALLLQARRPVDPALLERAAAFLLRHHDALRMRYARTPDGWTQHIAAPDDAAPVERIDLSQLSREERDPAFARHAARVQRSLDLEHGPLVRLALFESGEQGQRLLIAAHHLVVDAVSLAFLLPDLERVYGQLARGEQPSLPPKTTSFQHWARRMAQHAASGAMGAEAGFWLEQGDAAPLPLDMSEGSNTEGEAGFVTASLDAQTTRALLHDVPPVYGTQVNDALLAGLARAFSSWTGRSELWVDLEGHGREAPFADADLSRTAGWFTAIHPLRLDVPAEPGAALKAAKEQLRAVPEKGIGYGLLRWMADEETRGRLAALRPPQVSFNYLGQMDGAADGDPLLVPVADGTVGPTRSPLAPRTHLLSVDAAAEDGQLHVTWTYGTRIHRRETVERLAERYLAELRALVEHCRHPEAGGYTPSDFALAGLDQEGLDALLSRIG